MVVFRSSGSPDHSSMRVTVRWIMMGRGSDRDLVVVKLGSGEGKVDIGLRFWPNTE